ncbi:MULTISPECIES: hypothetical protein [unclassified Actinomyces]|uniref:hypothetical protein n=1 Tax=unclassified Actinomyces TaxID=2609248 RepID=UPI00137B9298|nr:MULTISPECIES: hypothetical protein [unclassified Actinomyces]MBW3069848.1 hypothetical protein [Actinomyces sp. 594]NDR53891.1 hypothetical protein [Actinomyces sp. 565]
MTASRPAREELIMSRSQGCTGGGSKRSGSKRSEPHFARHVLATFIVAVVVCAVFAALGRADNIPLVLLVAPIIGILDAGAMKLKHDDVEGKRRE